MKERFLRQLEWAGAWSGLVGAALLASHTVLSGYGFLAFLVSNVLWMAFAIRARFWGLLLMQVGFCVTSVIGLWRWLL